MKKKILTICLIVVLSVTSMGLTSATHTSTDLAKSVQSMAMFSASKWTDHYVAPKTDQIVDLLEEQGIFLSGPDATAQAVQAFQTEWAKRNPTTPNPKKLAALLKKERTGALTAAAPTAATPQIMSLAVPVEFPNSDTFDWCGETVTTTGPLHNQIPAPGPRDNNTIWYEDATPALYNELYFGVGKTAGLIVHHPNLGDVDLRGNTMANYYLEQSEGKFQPKGEVYPNWLQAAHSEGWYGADGCDGGSHNVRAWDLVAEVVLAVNADNPTFDWQTYDGDADGIVDNFTVLHAGAGQEAGGGQQGAFSIWSHASYVNYPDGVLACTKGSTGCPDRDIHVGSYSMDPENIDVGVISEEFGHAAFGLPDIYTTDAQGSPSNWAIMEAGSWNGMLGGMTPAPFPLYFRYLVGWAKPVELDYTTYPRAFTVGQLSQRPKYTQYGLKINMPDTQVQIPNPLGTGKAWWSTRADLSDFYLAHEFDLAGTTAPIFSFASYWSIEENWDYGYFEVSPDGGTTWSFLSDMDGAMTDTNPNGTNQGVGVTGEGSGTLRFDLSAFAGTKIMIRLRYSTDMATQWNGWWADDFALKDGATTLFSDDVENPPGDWSTNAWSIVPLTNTFPLYYLAEWRNLSGFDKGLAYPYTTIYNNEDTTEWQVERCPYTAPGMLLWLRNAAQSFDYTLYDSLYDAPSYGPKHALLVVDSHYWPLEWEGMGTSGAHLKLNSRCQPGNSTFTVQPTTPFTVDRSNAAGDILETKTFDALPAVSQFHDALGYYPGLRFRPSNNGLYFWDAPASLAVPASGSYTTKITDADKLPLTDYYGADLGDTVLGTGNPIDSRVQYGLNIAVVGKAVNGSWGRIVVWNSSTLTNLTTRVSLSKVWPGQFLYYTVKVKNTSPAVQKVSLSNPIPENTKFFRGFFYNSSTKSIEWTGKLLPYQTKVFSFWVRVNWGTPGATVIQNTATLTDDIATSTASATTTVRGY